MENKLRFAVKDIIDVDGLETGLGNRSYRKLYPSRTSSARCIDQLLNAGALLMGKTKTSQFAEGEVPSQWYGNFLNFQHPLLLPTCMPCEKTAPISKTGKFPDLESRHSD